MARPKKTEVVIDAAPEEPVATVVTDRVHEQPNRQTAAERIAESRKALTEPLGPDQAFFEAPDGFIMVGDKDRRSLLYRAGNGGKGMLINQRRA